MRLEQLTFTRFLAALSILIFHYGQGIEIFYNQYTTFIFEQANVGVSYFFILSGFVMIIAYGNKEKIIFWDFLKNRLARIYPIYFLAIILILISKLLKENTSDLILNLLMIQSWVPSKALTVNFPGWSLSVELFFYALFPFLLNYVYSKKTILFSTINILIFFLISQIVFHLIIYDIYDINFYTKRDIMYLPIMHLNSFLIGNLSGLFFLKYLKNRQKNYFYHILFTLSILVLLLKFPVGLNYHNGLLAIIFVPLIVFISLSTDKITKTFSSKPFIFLGEISFGVYILQRPVWNIFSDSRFEKFLNFNAEKDFSLLFILRFIILLVLASISYIYFEKPVRNYINSFSTKHLTKNKVII